MGGVTVNYMDVIHNLTGYRFGHMGLQNIGLNQGVIHKYGTEGRANLPGANLNSERSELTPKG
jgi:hypothetical protein